MATAPDALDLEGRSADGVLDEASRGFMIGLPARVASSVSEMSTGTVLLSVPILDDVIQVGTDGALATGTIEVAKNPSAMVIRRTDGRRLQAQILHHHEGGSASRRPVFLEPVRSLRLQLVPHAAGPALWLVLADVQVRRPPDLFQLLETITAFGLAKQRTDTSRMVPVAEPDGRAACL